ncbi:MAG: Asp-tRNA(Asn)/Glu-tRNA(Gln) amidotransferase subunit GatB [Alphaproteobacteria bacterium]|nr:Asp-tRNA(Asn)/Glu-tRNA(Gln) amidotransferase subunit GatB [Alphaproteobacteria bacterium]
MIIEGKTGPWEIVIGLEVHAQVVSNAKLFSGASTAFGAEPNAQVSFVDAAFPGMLPVINRACVEQAVKTGLGLSATINEVSVFDRKNYFYPDLPAGYQISQYKQPIVGEGHLDIDLASGETKRVGIERLHLEQDAGKSIHDQHPQKTYIDLNRAGVALMEIVSKPEMRSPEEAGAYMRKMRALVRYLGTCDGNMEEGSLRCDANVSVRRPGEGLGTRCELKNINSIRFVMQAIEYEARRQVEVLEDGGTIRQETRLFDSAKGVTRPMRSKEHAHDYRYFPDPDLLPLVLDRKWIEEVRASLPELPDAKKARFVSDYKLTPYDAGVLVAEKENAEFFEVVARGRKDPKLAANWVIVELFGALNRLGRDIASSPVSARQLAGLLDLIENDTISGRIAKDVFGFMVETGRDAAAIVEERGLRQVTDTGAIEAAIDKVIADSAAKVAEYRGGKQALFGWFVGQVMKSTGGKANPAAVNELLRKKLAG